MKPQLPLSPDASEESIRMWRAGRAAGWAVHRATSWRAPEGLPTERLVIYGGERFAQAMQQQRDVFPVPLPDPSWLCELPWPLRQRHIALTRPAPLRTACFLKPVHDKWFPAGVYPAGATLPPCPEESADQIYAAEVVYWETEWRLLVQEGTIIAGCRYAVGGRPAPDAAERAEEAIAFGRSVLSIAGAGLPAGVVLDVGEVSGRGWAVVGLNPAAESALYANPASSMLGVLAAAYGLTA